jgi:HK97 gp10 family phage protein
MSYKSNIPAISAGLAVKVDAATAAAAKQIAEDAKSRVPVLSGRLRDAIHTERVGPAAYAVVAGRGDVFYGHIVEHGGAHTPARPFLLPALEERRADAIGMISRALEDL